MLFAFVLFALDYVSVGGHDVMKMHFVSHLDVRHIQVHDDFTALRLFDFLLSLFHGYILMLTKLAVNHKSMSYILFMSAFVSQP